MATTNGAAIAASSSSAPPAAGSTTDITSPEISTTTNTTATAAQAAQAGTVSARSDPAAATVHEPEKTGNVVGAAAALPATTGTATATTTTTTAPAVNAMANLPESSPKPSDAALEQALKLEVLDKDKVKFTFGSLVQGQAGTPRVVVVFIRHFFCGSCQDYVRALCNTLPPSKLSSLTPATKLIIIGHGDPDLISKYAKETGCEFSIYTDKTRKLFNKFGFAVNLKRPKTRPDYIKRKMLDIVMDSFRQTLRSGSNMFSGGKASQNGGEMVFTEGKLGFFYRMKTTQDHTEPADLEKILTQ